MRWRAWCASSGPEATPPPPFGGSRSSRSGTASSSRATCRAGMRIPWSGSREGPASPSPGLISLGRPTNRFSPAPARAQVEHLTIGESTIDPVRKRHQLGVAADLRDSTTVDDDDAIRVLDARDPMGDQQDGPPPHEPGQRLLDVELALGVEIRRSEEHTSELQSLR